MIRRVHNMLHFFERLEKNASSWILLGIATLFFFLRLPSLFEPYWYGDEGIYEAIGMGMRHGRMLYSGIWDNKPPLLYVVYALFSGDQFAVRLVSLLLGMVSLFFLYRLGRILFNEKNAALIATGLFAILYGLPLIEGDIANAENFILFFVLAAAGLFSKFVLSRSFSSDIKKLQHQSIWSFAIPHSILLFSIGVLCGIAFLFKVVALFDFAAFITFLYIMYIYDDKTLSLPLEFLHQVKLLIAGFITPFLLSVLFFFFNGTLGDYIRGAFFSNVGYVNVRNEFILPQGLLILKVLLLGIALFLLLTKRKFFTPAMLFILVWFAFSLFNAHFSQRPYTHYLLVVLPSYILLISALFTKAKNRMLFLSLLLMSTGILLHNFIIFPVEKTVLYYGNFYQFVTKQKNVTDYQTFFDPRTPKYYDIASYIKSHTNPYDPVFIWGDVAQIYPLSDTLPVGKYTVAYHIVGRKDAIAETNKTVNTKKPRYVVFFAGQESLPFSLSEYGYKITIDDVRIYERIH